MRCEPSLNVALDDLVSDDAVLRMFLPGFDMLYKLRTFRLDAMSQFCPGKINGSIFRRNGASLACHQEFLHALRD